MQYLIATCSVGGESEGTCVRIGGAGETDSEMHAVEDDVEDDAVLHRLLRECRGGILQE